MWRFCADRLRVEAKVIWVCLSLIVIEIVREVDFLYFFHEVEFVSSRDLAGFREGNVRVLRLFLLRFDRVIGFDGLK